MYRSVILTTFLVLLISCSDRNGSDSGPVEITKEIDRLINEWKADLADRSGNELGDPRTDDFLVMGRTETDDNIRITFTETILLPTPGEDIPTPAAKVRSLPTLFQKNGFTISDETTTSSEFPKPQMLEFSFTHSGYSGVFVATATDSGSGRMTFTAIAIVNKNKR